VKQTYLPDELIGKEYYRPTDRGMERKLKAFMDKVRPYHRP
jgi:putative ATPase